MLFKILTTPIMMEGETGMAAIITAASSVLTALTGWATQITTWLIADPMAVMFLAIMFVMLGLHFVKSFIRTA